LRLIISNLQKRKAKKTRQDNFFFIFAASMGACLSIFGSGKNETETEGKEKLIGNEEQKDGLEGSNYSRPS